MRKLLLTLVTLMMTAFAFNINAAKASQMWLIGEPAGGWSPTTGLAMTETEAGSGIFTISVDLPGTKYFAFADQLGSNSGDWTTLNAHRYGPATNNATPKDGVPFNMVYGQDRSFTLPQGEYTLTVNTAGSTPTLTVSGKVEVVIGDIYVMGAMNGWGANEAYKLNKVSDGTYSRTFDTFTTEPFKLGTSDWLVSLSSENTAMTNETYTLVNGGMDNNMALIGPMTNVTFTLKLDLEGTSTLTINGTLDGDYKPDYSSWYVNVTGPFNGWGDNGVNPVDGISTTNNLEIGTQGFKIKVWPGGGSDIYYVTDGSEVELDTWTQLYQDAYNANPIQIAGATENSVYNVKFDVTNNKVYVELVKTEPVVPKSLYLIGNFNGNEFAADKGLAMTDEGDDIFVLNGVQITAAKDAEYGWVNFSENLGSTNNDWSGLGNRYGSKENNQEVTLDDEYPIVMANEPNSFQLEPGYYTVTVQFEDWVCVFEKYEVTATVTPANGTTVTVADPVEDFTFKVKFNDGVIISKATVVGDNKQQFDLQATPAVGTDNYAKDWTFTVPASVIRYFIMGMTPDDLEIANLAITIEAQDKFGREITGPGSPKGYFDLRYPISTDIIPGAPFEVDVEETVAEELSSFTVSVAAPLNTVSEGGFFNEITIAGEGYEGKATGIEEGVVTFSPAITMSGEYTITLPYGAFTLGMEQNEAAGDGVEGDNTSGPLGGNVTYGSEAKTVTFTLEVENESEQKGNDLEFDNKEFYPVGNTKYYFTPETDGTLKWEVYENGETTQTYVIGGLFDASNDQPVPYTAIDGEDIGGMLNTSWAEYELKAGTKYYFQWAKNQGGNDYSLFVTWTESGNDTWPPVFTQFDQLIQVGAFNKADPVIYQYTPATNGTMTIYMDEIVYYIGTGINEDNWITGGLWDGIIGEEYNAEKGGYPYEVKLMGNTTYYIGLPPNSNEGSAVNKTVYFEWQGSGDVIESSAVTSIYPPTAIPYDYINNFDVQVRGDGTVSSYGDVIFSYNEQNITLNDEAGRLDLQGPSEGQFLQIRIGNSAQTGLNNLIEQAALAGAESFTLTINNLIVNGVPVTGNDTEEEGVTVNNGVVTITYQLAQAPKYLAEDSTWPNVFYGNWTGVEDSKAVLVFSAPIKSVDKVEAVMGKIIPNVANETVYPTYDVDYDIEGNTLTLDFAGQKYECDGKTVTIKIDNVVGENGLPAQLGEYGTTMAHYLTFEAAATPVEYTYVLSGAIFLDGTNSMEMTVGEDGIATATATVQTQTFFINKMNGEEVVAVIGAETDVDAANQLIDLSKTYQGKEGSNIAWVLSAASTPTGTEVTFSFNPETLVLTAAKVQAEPVDFDAFTVTPDNLNTMEGIDALYGLTFTWNYPVEIVDPSLIYVQDPNNGADFTGENGLSVRADGNSLIIDVLNGPLQYLGFGQAWKFAGVYNGGIKVNGQLLETTNEGISTQITYASVGETIPEPEYSAIKGLNHQNLPLSEIKMNWPGYYVGYDEDNNWNSVQEAIKVWYFASDSEWDITKATPISVTLGFEDPASPNGSRWYETLVVKPTETLDKTTGKYMLTIPSYKITFKNIETDNYDSYYSEAIEATFTIGNMPVIPGIFQSVKYSDWKGLVIQNATANNVSVADASKVKLYKNFIDNKSTYDEVKDSPLASGVNASEGDEVVVSFDYTVFDGPYCIAVEDGALNGMTDWSSFSSIQGVNGVHFIDFSIVDHQIDIEDIQVTTEPAEEATVESIESVKVWWGDYLMLNDPNALPGEGGLLAEDIEVSGPYTGTMSVDGGQPTDIEWYIMKSLITSATDDETGEGDGVDYRYWLQYTPAQAITTPGAYEFNVPAGIVNVYVNGMNELANNAVSVKFNVTAPVELPAPTIRVLPNGENTAWFDAYGVIYFAENGTPYTLELGDTSGVTVTENMVDDVEVVGVTLTEYQKDLESTNYEDVQLVVTLNGFQFGQNSLYTLTIPAGSFYVIVDGQKVPNKEIVYSFTQLDTSYPLYYGEYTVTPECVSFGPATDVKDLSTVTLYFNGAFISVDQEGADETKKIFAKSSNIDNGDRFDLPATAIKVANGDKDLIVDLSAYVDGEGTYEITFPERSITLNVGGEMYANQELSFTYVIKAPEFIDVEAVVDPENNTNQPPLGDVSITWPGVSLEMANTTAGAQNVVDPSNIKVYINNNQYTNFGNGTGNGMLYLTHRVGTDSSDSAEVEYGDYLVIQLPDMGFWWRGAVRFEIGEGAVTSTDGAINEALTINYNVFDVENVEWEPAQGDGVTTFTVGEGEFFASWAGYTAALNPTPDMAPYYEMTNAEGEKSDRTDATSIISVAEGKIKVDVSGLEPGNYTFVLPTGSVLLTDAGDGMAMNNEGVYNFIILPAPVETALVFDSPFEVEFVTDVTTAVEVELPINIQLKEGETIKYQGLQFDITLPEWLAIESVTKNKELSDDMLVSVSDRKGNAYTVILTTSSIEDSEYRGTNITDDILTLNLVANGYSWPAGVTVPDYFLYGTTQYADGQLVPVTIADPVIMSDNFGERFTINGFEGNAEVVITPAVHITSIAVNTVDLAWPSYMAEFVPNITIGENLDITIEVTPEETTDLVNVEATNGVEVIFDEDSNTYKVLTADATAEGEVTITWSSSYEGGTPVTAEYKFNLRNVVRGDSNDDTYVDVADVVTTANYVAADGYDNTVADYGYFTLDNWIYRFDYPNGNLVGEEEINVQDINATVNIIMGKDDMYPDRRNSAPMLTNDALVADDFKVSLNKPFQIGVGLDNTFAYASLQADVEIPAGMNVVSVTKGARAAAHNLIYNVLDNGNVRVVLYSMNNAAFTEGNGTLFNLMVTANDEAGNVRIDNIRAADAAANGYDLGFSGGQNDSLLTGIYDLSADEDGSVRYFTVDGLEIRNPEAGQIVIRVEGNKVEKMIVK